MVAVVHYAGHDDEDYFDRWMRRQSSDVRARIQTRIDRIELGNLGDHKSVAKGVLELRIHFGPGYRVYLGEMAKRSRSCWEGTKRRQCPRHRSRAASVHVNWRSECP